MQIVEERVTYFFFTWAWAEGKEIFTRGNQIAD